MACKYSGYTWFILVGMIITGAARSIAVKLAYQLGCNAPLTITLLYLLGQSLSLIVYGLQKWLTNSHDYITMCPRGCRRVKRLETGSYVAFDDADKPVLSVISGDHLDDKSPRNISIELDVCRGIEAHVDERNCTAAAARVKPIIVTNSILSDRTSPLSEPSSSSSLSACSSSSIISCAIFEFLTAHAPAHEDDDKSVGSKHGLSRQSEQRIMVAADQIPFYLKPAIPAILNLLNSALRWGSLIYIDASVAEMMISGLELTLGVVASRIFRKRMVATSRWVGIIIVAVGVIIIERANNIKSKRSESADEDNEDNFHTGTPDVMIGVCLIILQSILSALQDVGEEIFMQATNFPATLLLGMEGLYGFCIGLIIYFAFGNQLRLEDIDATRSMLNENTRMRWWFLGLPFLFLLTGVFNIKATEVTSAMTRNVWKNFRTVLVWAIALGCFYLGNNPAYGEAWYTPESFIILLGFMVMGCGIVVYYWFKEQEQSASLLAKGQLV